MADQLSVSAIDNCFIDWSGRCGVGGVEHIVGKDKFLEKGSLTVPKKTQNKKGKLMVKNVLDIEAKIKVAILSAI